MRFEQWSAVFDLDEAMRETLREFAPLVCGAIDRIMDAVYAYIAVNPDAAATFASPEARQRARAAQQRHWTEHVFVGRFGPEYQKATRAIGHAHFRAGVDLRLYLGAYAVVLNESADVVASALAGRPADQARYLAALNRAVFLDMGLATSVYYDSLLAEVEAMAQELNFSLARAGEFRDNATGHHLTRMSRMCAVLARAIGMEEKWVRMLQIASPLHDVGKIGIPDRVLLKPGRLDEEEAAIMRTHPLIGADIIPESTAAVIGMARRISLTHHERWDGSGYPNRLRGNEIPLEGRIAAICDVYDALVSERPYKDRWSADDALAYLRTSAGSHFDPDLVEAFQGVRVEIDQIQAQFAEATA